MSKQNAIVTAMNADSIVGEFSVRTGLDAAKAFEHSSVVHAAAQASIKESKKTLHAFLFALCKQERTVEAVESFANAIDADQGRDWRSGGYLAMRISKARKVAKHGRKHPAMYDTCKNFEQAIKMTEAKDVAKAQAEKERAKQAEVAEADAMLTEHATPEIKAKLTERILAEFQKLLASVPTIVRLDVYSALSDALNASIDEALSVEVCTDPMETALASAEVDAVEYAKAA